MIPRNGSCISYNIESGSALKDVDHELGIDRLSVVWKLLPQRSDMYIIHIYDDYVCWEQAKSQFKSRSIANNVEIIIPVPNDVDSPTFKASIGSVSYMPDQVSGLLVTVC